MDLNILAVILTLQMGFTIIGYLKRSMYAFFFAVLTGFLMNAQIVADGGIVTYWSNGTLVTLSLGGFILIIFTLLTFLDAMGLISLHNVRAG